jgi:hypothetical protein
MARCTTLPPAGPATRVHPYTCAKRTMVGRATRECSPQEVIVKVLERSSWSASRTTARIVGVLFIVATVVDVLASVLLLRPIINSPDYLIKMAANEHQVILGALLLVVAAFASPAIALWLYPVLRERSKGGLALGSVGFRLIEGVFYGVNVVVLLSLLTLSQEFVKAGASASSSFDTAGTVLLAARDWASLVGILAFYLAASMYYYIFYRSRLVPRWLLVWGFVGVLLGTVAALLVMFHVTESMSTVQVVFNLPIGVQEMVLAVWLIVKGFSASSTPSPSAELA